MTKTDLYDVMAQQLAPYWERDSQFRDEEEQRGTTGVWSQAREIDDWLVQYREDERVSVSQYARNCERLLALYTTTAREACVSPSPSLPPAGEAAAPTDDVIFTTTDEEEAL